jgi:hypothetical protein
MADFKCPSCKGSSAQVWALPKFTLLHWIINPGLAVNELVLGQAIPRETYICNDCNKPLMDRSYFHCPTCDSFHNSKIWSGKNAIGRWFGYLCPRCTQPIPRLWNLTSLLILGITMPIWWIPAQTLRPKWIAKEKRRMNVDPEGLIPPPVEVKWYEAGLCFGITTGLLITLFNIFLGSGDLQRVMWKALFSVPVWIIMGLVFGFVMKKFSTKTPDKKKEVLIYLDGTVKQLNAPQEQFNQFNQSQNNQNQPQYQKNKPYNN